MTKNCFEQWGWHALGGQDVRIIDDDLAAARQLEKIWRRSVAKSPLTEEALIVISERIKANERLVKRI
jgi:hypothetical protein